MSGGSSFLLLLFVCFFSIFLFLSFFFSKMKTFQRVFIIILKKNSTKHSPGNRILRFFSDLDVWWISGNPAMFQGWSRVQRESAVQDRGGSH